MSDWALNSWIWVNRGGIEWTVEIRNIKLRKSFDWKKKAFNISFLWDVVLWPIIEWIIQETCECIAVWWIDFKRNNVRCQCDLQKIPSTGFNIELCIGSIN